MYLNKYLSFRCLNEMDWVIIMLSITHISFRNNLHVFKSMGFQVMAFILRSTSPPNYWDDIGCKPTMNLL